MNKKLSENNYYCDKRATKKQKRRALHGKGNRLPQTATYETRFVLRHAQHDGRGRIIFRSWMRPIDRERNRKKKEILEMNVIRAIACTVANRGDQVKSEAHRTGMLSLETERQIGCLIKT